MRDRSTIDGILAAAEIEFATNGFAGARVDRIAERAGVNKATLYYRIGDKQQIYATVLRSTIDRVLVSLREAVVAANSPQDRIRSLVAILAGTARANPHFPSLMLREIAGGGGTLPPQVADRFAEAVTVVAGILRDGADNGSFRRTDPLLTHMMITGMILVLSAGTPLRKRMRSRLKMKSRTNEMIDDEFTEEVSRFVIAGLSKHRTT